MLARSAWYHPRPSRKAEIEALRKASTIDPTTALAHSTQAVEYSVSEEGQDKIL